MALSAVFLGLVRPAKRGLLCRSRTPLQVENTHHCKEDIREPIAEQMPEEKTDGHVADTLINKLSGSVDSDVINIV